MFFVWFALSIYNDIIDRRAIARFHCTYKSYILTSCQKSSGGNERETVLKNISSAYDAFMELKGNLEEGTKFYNDLTEILVKFQSKVKARTLGGGK